MRKRRRKRSSMDSDDDRQDLWAPSGDNEIKVTTHTGFKEVEMRSEWGVMFEILCLWDFKNTIAFEWSFSFT